MLKLFYRVLLDLLFPLTCVGCKSSGSHLCGVCATRISEGAVHEYERLSVIAAREDSSHRILAGLVHRFKYQSSEEIGGILAALVPEKFFAHIQRPVIFVPVPLHARRVRIRGFNQSEILATHFSRKTDIPVEKILTRNRYTQPQVALSREDRIKNVCNAFTLSPHVKKLDPALTYCLVDDIATTGSTLTACAEVLRRHGAERIVGFVIARGL